MSDWYSSEMNWKWNIGNIWGKLTSPFTEFFHWAVKSAQYAKLLWNDYDWDYAYIFNLLQYKLKRTRKRIVANNLILRSEEVAAQIKHAEDLIEKWREDEFCKDLYDAHDEKWGEMVDLSKPVEHNGSRYHIWDMSREKATTPELKDQEKKEWMAIHQKADEAKEKNLDELFAHMRKYIQGWWD